jgi:hypothetical protein
MRSKHWSLLVQIKILALTGSGSHACGNSHLITFAIAKYLPLVGSLGAEMAILKCNS